MKIYVGNLSFQTTEDRLRELFEEDVLERQARSFDPGEAILAIPIMSIIAIVCDAFPQTRFVAILLADRLPERDDTVPDRPAA